MARLERHRRAILGAVFAIWLGVVAFAFAHSPVGPPMPECMAAGSDLFHVAMSLVPFLGVALLGAHCILRALTSRALGQALDRRPFYVASSSAALGVFAVMAAFSRPLSVSLPAGIVAVVLFGAALYEWATLIALVGSKEYVAHRDAAVQVPRVVASLASPVVLFAPADPAYRTEAKGTPIAAVPEDRTRAKRVLIHSILTACAIAVVGTVIAVPLLSHPNKAPCDASEDFAHTTWRGDVEYGSGKQRFTLNIEDASYGKLQGTMDWGDTVATVEGTYDGNELVFYDRAVVRTNGAPFILNERKDVHIHGDVMVGTDKDGKGGLRATRVRDYARVR